MQIDENLFYVKKGVTDDVAVFPCLKELYISKCPHLVKVSLEELPSFRVLKVYKCGDGVLRSLVGVGSSVRYLRISCISELNDKVLGGIVQSLREIEELEIERCNEIRYLWESKEACKDVLVNLNKLYIYSCEKLVRIGGGKKEGEEGSNLPTSLRMLQIKNCWNLEDLSCPNSIETLDISFCGNLKHLSCPANSIQELMIWNCSSITSVSLPTIEGGGGWQKLKSLRIEKCNSVLERELEKQVLNVNNNTNILPTLQVLHISDFQDLNSITKVNCFVHLTRLEIRSCPMIIEPFPDLQNLTSLTHLVIWNCPRMDAPPVPSGSGGVRVWPPKLGFLIIGGLKRPMSEWGLLPTSLVDLKLIGGLGSYAAEDVKIFPASLLIPSSSSLNELTLWGFKELESISGGLQQLTSLRHLKIYDCPKLKDLPEKLLILFLSLVGDPPNEELKEKMSRGGSYWSLLSNIPKVDLRSS